MARPSCLLLRGSARGLCVPRDTCSTTYSRKVLSCMCARSADSPASLCPETLLLSDLLNLVSESLLVTVLVVSLSLSLRYLQAVQLLESPWLHASLGRSLEMTL